MNKRKSSDSNDETRKKIARLEKRLARYKEKDKHAAEDLQDQTHEISSVKSNEEFNTSIPVQTEELDPENIIDYNSDAEVNLNDEPNEDQVLDSDFLSALGEHDSSERKYSENIHEQIFTSIKNILIDGLTKQNKEKIIETLMIPSNCKLLDAPKLNVELSSILNNATKSRDVMLQERQQDLGQSIGTICTLINSMSRRDFDKITMIKKLTDVARVLCNLHFLYTDIRRKLINPHLDKSLTEALKENKRETYIYSNLEDSVKSFNTIKRASITLKPKPQAQPKAINPKNFQQAPRRPSFNQGPPRRGSVRGAAHSRYLAQQRPPFRPQDNRRATNRGRAKYP